jgi:LmbE family N-acetylglucosaminyl deacetylase
MTRERLAAMREIEAVAAGKLLGVESVYFLRQTDGELQPTLELRSQVASYFRRLQIDTVLTFDPYNRGQIHADHRAAGQAALDAFMPAKMPMYHPEQLTDGVGVSVIERIYLFGSDQPDLWIDIGDTFEMKVEAMLAHESQAIEKEQFRTWMLTSATETARDREGVQYAEAFRTAEVW